METRERPCPPRHPDKAEHSTKLAEKTIVTVSGFSHDFSFLMCSCLSSAVSSRRVVIGTHWVRKFQIEEEKKPEK